MSPELLAAATAYFRSHEGVIDHLYLCVHGKPTAGVGHMFPTAKAARAAGWHRNGVYASWSEIDAEWARVNRMPFGVQFPASSFARATSLRLSQRAIDNLLRSDLEAFERALVAMFPGGWDHYPMPAQLGLLDLVFSLGPTGFRTGYPRCLAAAQRGDWATCAIECKRGGVAPRRDAALKALFESAIPAKKDSQ